MSPKLSIIIVNWNGEKYLKNCLTSIFYQSYKNYGVIIVDNGSTDNSIADIKDKFPSVKIIKLDKNYGFVRGNNIGIKYAYSDNSDYFLLLNNDTKMVNNDFLERLIDVAKSKETIGILGCKIIFPDGRIQHLGTKFTPFRQIFLKRELSKEPYDVDGIMGSVFLIKKSVVEKIGLLDEGYSPFLHEETDYCLRAKKAGFSIKVIPELEVIHYWYKSMERISQQFVSIVYYRNSIRYKLLNTPLLYIVPRLFLTFVTSIFEKENNKNKLWNIKLKKNFPLNLLIFFKATFINIKDLPEIIRKRANRTEKIWY